MDVKEVLQMMQESADRIRYQFDCENCGYEKVKMCLGFLGECSLKQHAPSPPDVVIQKVNTVRLLNHVRPLQEADFATFSLADPFAKRWQCRHVDEQMDLVERFGYQGGQ